MHCNIFFKSWIPFGLGFFMGRGQALGLTWQKCLSCAMWSNRPAGYLCHQWRDGLGWPSEVDAWGFCLPSVKDSREGIGGGWEEEGTCIISAHHEMTSPCLRVLEMPEVTVYTLRMRLAWERPCVIVFTLIHQWTDNQGNDELARFLGWANQPCCGVGCSLDPDA